MKTVTLVVLNNFVNDSRVLKESISLKKNGYDVTVVALHKEGLEEYDNVNGVEVHRIKLRTKNWSNNLFVQLIKYIELLIKIVKQYRHTDYYHSNDLSPLPLAVLIKKLFNKNMFIVYDAHELETERKGLRGFRKTLVKLVEKIFIRYVDSMITVSDGIAIEYEKKYNINKPFIVKNCPHYKKPETRNIFREKFDIAESSKIFLYQGGLSEGRRIELILETFSKLNNENAVLVLMGYGPLEQIVINHAEKYNNIFYHEAVPYNQLLEYTASADVGFSFLEDSCLNHALALPNKFFEYAMAGLVIVSNELPEMSKLIRKHDVGYIVKEMEVKELMKTINEIVNDERLSDKKGNSLNLAKKYNWENQESVLLEAYNRNLKD